MFSLSQYCTNHCFNKLSIAQSRQFSNHNSKPTFCQLSSQGKKKQKIKISHKWRIWGSDDGSCGVAPELHPSGPSVLDLIHQFYEAINAKDIQNLNNKLDQLLTEDCVYEDLFFYIPFKGREDIKKFLCNVVDAMGPNVEIYLDPASLKDGDIYTASVIWHLKWQDKEIPFTTGCNFFECTEVKGKLLIRKITGVEEFPVKPGDYVLKLLKAATTVLDRYPFLAEGLKSHDSQVSHGKHEGGLPGLDALLDMLGRKN